MEKINQKLRLWRLKALNKLIPVLLSGLVFCLPYHKAYAGLTLISDEESELYLQELISPIFKAAGIPFNRNKIFIVEDNSLNAFVSDGNNLFINSEVILKAANADEIRGIAAHETGHISGGHIIRHKLQQHEMQNISLASMAIAGVLGAASGRGDVAAAIALGSHSSLINQTLAYQISEERNADEKAVELLQKINVSPQGLLNFMKKIQTQNKLQGIDENNYVRTHPMSGERLAFLQQAVQHSSYKMSGSKDDKLKRIQAKLYAFIRTPQQTALRYPLNDTSLPAQYARAIAALKGSKLNKALSITNNLIDVEPRNPHFRELKGQILLELRKINEAQSEFSQATKLLPNSALFQINEAQAALETSPSQAELKTIIIKLQKALHSRQTQTAWLLLSRAYAMNGQKAEAQYAAAEYSARNGDISTARKQAEEAKKNSIDPNFTLKINDLLRVLAQIQKR